MGDAFTREKDRCLTASGGISLVNMQDRYFSALPYRGVAGLVSLGFKTETASYWDDLSLYFRNGKMAMDIPSVNTHVKTTFTGGNIHYSHVRKLKTGLPARHFFLAGGNFNSSACFYKRSHYGDNYHYVYQSSIGPSIAFHYALTENGLLQFCGRADFSLAGYVITPSYGSVMPENILDKALSEVSGWDYVTGGKIMTLNKFQRANCSVGLSCGIFRRFSVLLGYSWDFIHLNREDDLFQAVHNMHLSLIYH